MSKGRKVLVTATNYSRLCAESMDLFRRNDWHIVENTLGRPMTFDELKQSVSDADAAVAGTDAWDEAVFKHAPKLRIIARFGVGVDNIDVETARGFGIKVTNAAGRNANAVAEITIGLLLAAMRNIPNLDRAVRQGIWVRSVGEELVGRTVGLLGFGNIGQKVARKLLGFDVQVIAFDKYPNMEVAKQLGVKMVSAQEALRQSDVLCLLLPSVKETYHFMNSDSFALMKNGAYFVNTARGALVDEEALYTALNSGKLAAAAIDVYEVEPVSADNPLFLLANIVTTPHTAAETFETYRNVGLYTAQSILDEFEGKNPPKGL
jgi:D-3-phosphoglycerate dehydrogenase / 2-oxoglutarate reductase